MTSLIVQSRQPGALYTYGGRAGTVLTVPAVEWDALRKIAPLCDRTDEGGQALMFFGVGDFQLTVFVLEEAGRGQLGTEQA